MLRKVVNPLKGLLTSRNLATQEFITSPEQLRPHVKKIYDDVKEFMIEECHPKELAFMEHADSDNKWQIWPEIENLKETGITDTITFDFDVINLRYKIS